MPRLFAVALVVAVGAGAGCTKSSSCTAGALVVRVSLDSFSAGADTLTMIVVVDGATYNATATHVAGSVEDTIAVRFPGAYPTGGTATIRIAALGSGQLLAESASESTTLAAGCTSLALSVEGITPADMAVNSAVSFIVAAEYPGERLPQSVAIGDLDGDGKPEVVAGTLGGAYGDDRRILVWKNQGNGTFAGAQPWATGATPGNIDAVYSVALADVNGDGRLDIIAANYFTRKVAVLLNDGNGGFPAFVNYVAGDFPISIAAADFNGDGKPDFAVTNAGGVSVFLNNGDGTFGTPTFYALGSASFLTAGDLDGSGRPDLVVASLGNVAVLLNSGNGTFAISGSYVSGSYPNSIALADLDGDGRLDVAVANKGGFNPGPGGDVAVLLNSGGGNLRPALHYPVGDAPSSVVASDFDGDGHADLAVASEVSGYASILFNRGDGTLFTPINYIAVADDPTVLAVGDLYGDGHAALVVGSIGKDDFAIMRNDGHGAFLAARSFTTTSGADPVAVGDFDGDGKPDVVVGGDADVSVLANRGDGTFAPRVSYAAGIFPSSIAVGDLNGDGKLDLALADYHNDASGSGKVSLLLNHGDGTFAPAVGVDAGPYPIAVALGDIDGDGKLDLYVAGDAAIRVLRNNGNGAFAPAAVYPAQTYPSSIAIADFDGNGRSDVAVSGTPAVTVLLDDGRGGLGSAHAFAAGGRFAAVAAGDLDGDGRPDLAVSVGSRFGVPSILVLMSEASGAFAPAVSYVLPNPSPGGTIAIADLNADGRADIAVGALDVLLNRGDGTFGAAHSFTAGMNPRQLALGDFNGDGLMDVAITSISGCNVLINNTPR